MADNQMGDPGSSGTFFADRVGALIESLPRTLTAQRFERLSDATVTAGHWGLLAVAVLGFFIEAVGATVFGGSTVLWGVGWLIVLPLLQYAAVQFLGATRTMVTENRTTLGTHAFLRCYALLALVGGIVALLGAVIQGADMGSFRVFLAGLAIAALWLGTAWLALNPELLGIRVARQASPAEEAIGVISFFVKSGVRIVPILYGVTLVVAAVQAAVILLGMVDDSSHDLMVAVTRAELSAPVVILAVLAPFGAYVAFVLYALVIGLLRGILHLQDGPSGRGPGPGGSGGGGRGGSGGTSRPSGGAAAAKKTSASTTSSKKAAGKKRAVKKAASKRTASRKKAGAAQGGPVSAPGGGEGSSGSS